MATHDSIRHILEQPRAAGRQRIEAGDVSGDELDALRSFTDDVEKLIVGLRQEAPGITKQTLFKELVELHKRCTGPLEGFRGWIEDALSVVETIAQ